LGDTKTLKFTRLNVYLVVLLNASAITLLPYLLPKSYQTLEAQNSIQVRTEQWLNVDQVSGDVRYRNLYNYTNRAARVGDRLQVASDEISTGSNGSAVLTIDTGVGSIYIAENTTVQIRSMQVAADNGRITNLYIPRGKARLQIRKFTHIGSQLNIQTPAGISGVRGTKFIVHARPNGNTVLTTIEGSVASSAQNQTKIVNGGFENFTVMGKPPSDPVAIANDPSLKYVISRKTSGLDRSVLFSGYTNPFNIVKVNGVEKPLDRSGKFSLQLPVTSNLKIRVTVETSTGKIQTYEIPVL
jgi:hypothetical protein